MARPSAELKLKAIELSELSEDEFQKLPKQEKSELFKSASAALNIAPEEVDDSEESAIDSVELIEMVRNPDKYPNGPLTALVHPLEVENYAIGGWVKRAN